MQRNLIRSLFIAFAVAGICAVAAPEARASGGCSLATVAGKWSFSYQGVAVLPSGQIPVAAVGKFTTDAAGNFTGDEINSLAGTAAFQTLVGTINVDSSCDGALVAKVYQAGALVRTSYIHLQYTDNATELSAIFQKLVLPNGSSLPVVITIDGKRI